jgi:hypothetical protein
MWRLYGLGSRMRAMRSVHLLMHALLLGNETLAAGL